MHASDCLATEEEDQRIPVIMCLSRGDQKMPVVVWLPKGKKASQRQQYIKKKDHLSAGSLKE
ncbi:hypothetical protein E2C01_033732 [Portunus trituberculatus]|uniref:Uncharacterized protein n=1 Tax=Portunus trituberculatus TaxID=210409 RepID=A0A5B7F474_PORTR|nr:hypothetical protein [Portunus trituberculatus]